MSLTGKKYYRVSVANEIKNIIISRTLPMGRKNKNKNKNKYYFHGND